MTDKSKAELIQEYKDKLKFEVHNPNREAAHITADKHLCDLLIELGYEKVVDTYNDVNKHYA